MVVNDQHRNAQADARIEQRGIRDWFFCPYCRGHVDFEMRGSVTLSQLIQEAIVAHDCVNKEGQ
jgi:hypothetical protein